MPDPRDDPKYKRLKARNATNQAEHGLSREERKYIETINEVQKAVDSSNDTKALAELIQSGNSHVRKEAEKALLAKHGGSKRKVRKAIEDSNISNGAKPGLIRRFSGW